MLFIERHIRWSEIVTITHGILLWLWSLWLKIYVNLEFCERAHAQDCYVQRQIREYPTVYAFKTVILGLVITHLGNSNGLFYKMPDTDTKKLQRVQNAAAKLVWRKGKRDMAHPVWMTFTGYRSNYEFGLKSCWLSTNVC